jgi:surface antigen
VYKGDAKGYFSRASQFGLDAYQNGKSTTPPQMGDIICSNKGNHGHVAIVRQVIDDPTGRSIRVIHQNYANIPSKDSNGQWTFNQKANYLELKMTKNKYGQYRVGNFDNGYPVIGWLHRPN